MGLLDGLFSAGSGILGSLSNPTGWNHAGDSFFQDNTNGMLGLAAGFLTPTLPGQRGAAFAQGLQNYMQGDQLDQQQQNINLTRDAAVKYAQANGMTDAQVQMIKGSKEAQMAIVQKMFTPKPPIEVSAGASLDDPATYKPLYQAPNKPGEGNFSLSPVYFKDKDGNTLVGQLGRDGTLQMPNVPDGLQVAGNYSPEDLGTGVGSFNKRTGQMEGPVTPKDIAGKASQDVQGQAQGQAAANLPQALAQADQALQTVQDIRTAKEKGWLPHTGIGAMANFIPGTSGYDFQRKADQLQGQTFLQAYNQLKGAGAITDIEGKKASDAISAISTGMSGEAFDKALSDLETVITAGKQRLAQKATAAPIAPGGQIPALGVGQTYQHPNGATITKVAP